MTHSITGDKESPDMRASSIPLGSAQPILSVSNVAEGVEHYRTVLGFFLEFAMHDESGAPYFANLWRGELSVFLVSREGLGPSSTLCNLRDPAAIDALYDDLVKAGANITEPPEHKPWGIYAMKVVDLDKNEFSFTCSSPAYDGTSEYEDLRG